MTKPTFTFAVWVHNGTLEVRPYRTPEVAPPPGGYSEPLRTVAAVKSYARQCVAYSGYSTDTKRAARAAISNLTIAECRDGINIWF